MEKVISFYIRFMGAFALPVAVLAVGMLSIAAYAEQAAGKSLNEPEMMVGAPVPLRERRMELSGCAVVEGGVLLVEDELIGAVLLLENTGRSPLVVSTVKLERKKKARAPFTDAFKLFPFQDFEGIASDGLKTVYLIGSHHGKDGERRPDREFLFKGEWDEKDKELKVVGEQYALLEHLAPALEGLGVDIGLTKTAVSEALNIEGLALYGDTLYIGLRSPLTSSGKAILLSGPVDDIMKRGATLERAELDLNGDGIRALSWDPVRGELLVLGGASGDTAADSALHGLNPSSGVLRPILSFTAEIAGKSPEGVCRLLRENGGKLLVVLDGEGGDVGGEIIEIDG